MIRVLLVSLALVVPASAQPAQPYTPPSAELWSLMGQAFDDLPMSMASHQAIRQIMGNVQREAQTQATLAKARKPEAPDDQK